MSRRTDEMVGRRLEAAEISRFQPTATSSSRFQSAKEAVTWAKVANLKKEQEEWNGAICKISSTPGPHDPAVWEAAAKWDQGQDGSVNWQSAERCGAYLQGFGYAPSTLAEWRTLPAASHNGGGIPLTLSLSIVEESMSVQDMWRTPAVLGTREVSHPAHVEEAGCTWYRVDCVLGPIYGEQQDSLVWCAPRRLKQLRDGLHFCVKNMLGEAYPPAFVQTPFAQFGAPRGTTDRLRDWLTTLSALINQGEASPAIVALTLSFFRAPGTQKHVRQLGGVSQVSSPSRGRGPIVESWPDQEAAGGVEGSLQAEEPAKFEGSRKAEEPAKFEEPANFDLLGSLMAESAARTVEDEFSPEPATEFTELATNRKEHVPTVDVDAEMNTKRLSSPKTLIAPVATSSEADRILDSETITEVESGSLQRSSSKVEAVATHVLGDGGGTAETAIGTEQSPLPADVAGLSSRQTLIAPVATDSEAEIILDLETITEVETGSLQRSSSKVEEVASHVLRDGGGAAETAIGTEPSPLPADVAGLSPRQTLIAPAATASEVESGSLQRSSAKVEEVATHVLGDGGGSAETAIVTEQSPLPADVAGLSSPQTLIAPVATDSEAEIVLDLETITEVESGSLQRSSAEVEEDASHILGDGGEAAETAIGTEPSPLSAEVADLSSTQTLIAPVATNSEAEKILDADTITEAESESLHIFSSKVEDVAAHVLGDGGGAAETAIGTEQSPLPADVAGMSSRQTLIAPVATDSEAGKILDADTITEAESESLHRSSSKVEDVAAHVLGDGGGAAETAIGTEQSPLPADVAGLSPRQTLIAPVATDSEAEKVLDAETIAEVESESLHRSSPKAQLGHSATQPEGSIDAHAEKLAEVEVVSHMHETGTVDS